MLRIRSGEEWSFDKVEEVYNLFENLAREKYKLNFYPNQLEIITSEQMLDSYASIGMPIYYTHWTFGRQFILNHEAYKKGYQGLAYEIVINSNPCIAYLMEENTMAMQALVIAHASFGHNHFFKNNYLFKQWTDASAIIDYLVFAKKFIAKCEERYGMDEVEAVLDAAHSLMNHGIDKYKRPPRLSAAEEERQRKERDDYIQTQLNDIWRTIPITKDHMVQQEDPESFPKEPQENILYFIEKNAPNLPEWKREIIRIVRKVSQYFYPQGRTQLMNEGFACVVGDTLIDTPNGLIRAEDIVQTKYNGLVTGRDENNKVTQWHNVQNKNRIKVTLKNGLSLHGGTDHQILVNNEWIRLENLVLGQKLPVIRGKNEWPDSEIHLPQPIEQTKLTLFEKCEDVGVHIKTYYKWLNNSGTVSDKKAAQCQEVYDYINSHHDLVTLKNVKTRSPVNIPDTLTEQFAYWLGLITGDGGLHYGKHSKIYFVSGDTELRDWFVNYSQDVLGVNVVVRSDRNHWVATIYNRTLFDYLTNVLNFEFGKTSNIKQVPTQIYRSPAHVVKAFIRGHMDTDGGVCKQSGNIILVSRSQKLISVEQQLLLKMGIVSSVSFQPNDNCYRLTISGSDSLLFSQEIKFNLPRKQQLLEQHHNNKIRYLEKNDESEIVAITHDVGPVYDFGVENTHEYKASGFINHNCFTHYHMMHDLYNQGIIDEGAMLEFYKDHTNVVFQPDFDDRRYSGINPYALGFAIYMDIKRVTTEPTQEDIHWFGKQDWVGSGDWIGVVKWAAENFKDESFVLQFLSPKVIRDFKLFSVHDDEKDPKIEIAGIHNEQGYKTVRTSLSHQYNFGYRIPDIQVVNVNRWGDRSIKLRHYMVNDRPLEPVNTTKVMKNIAYLWGYNVSLESVNSQGDVKAMFNIKDNETLLDLFEDDK